MIGDMGKYRPRIFDEVIGQKRVVERIRNQSRSGVWFSSQVLEGHWGSGKTTLARIMAKAMNCSDKDERGNPCGVCPFCRAVAAGSPDYKEIDAASNTGVDNVRSLIEWAGYRPAQLKCKVIVIDEAQQLSASAWNAMLKLIEEPPEYMRFIFCTTDFNKIPETIRSRCAHYQLAAIPEEEIAAQIRKVAGSENVDITEGAARLLAKQAHGAMRDGLRILREMSAAGRKIDEQLVKELSPVGEEKSTVMTLRALLLASIPELLSAIDVVEKSGRDFVSLMAAVISLCSDCVIRVTGAEISGSAAYVETVDQLCDGRKLVDFLSVSKVVLRLRDAMLLDPHKEHLIVTAASAFDSEAGLSLRMAVLEEMVKKGAVYLQKEEAEKKPAEEKDAVPFEEGEPVPQIQVPEEKHQKASRNNPMDDEENEWDDIDIFGEYLDEDEEAPHDSARIIEEPIAGKTGSPVSKPSGVSEKAKAAEIAVSKMIMAEDALGIHFVQKRIRYEYAEAGLKVICGDLTLAKLFMAFAGKYEIADLEVVVGE